MNLHQATDLGIQNVVKYLRQRYAGGYEFEIRNGKIWERNVASGRWYPQGASPEFWHKYMRADGWPTP